MIETNEYICIVLRRLGVTRLTIEFSGSGDSGAIDNWEIDGVITDLKNIPFDKALVTVKMHNDTLAEEDNPVDVAYEVRSASSMEEWLGDWIDTYATEDCRVDFDWYNNDGGGGTLTFFPMEGRCELESYYYETVSTQRPDEKHDADCALIPHEAPFTPKVIEENAEQIDG